MLCCRIMILLSPTFFLTAPQTLNKIPLIPSVDQKHKIPSPANSLKLAFPSIFQI